jgi:hypothetical protein
MPGVFASQRITGHAIFALHYDIAGSAQIITAMGAAAASSARLAGLGFCGPMVIGPHGSRRYALRAQDGARRYALRTQSSVRPQQGGANFK